MNFTFHWRTVSLLSETSFFQRKNLVGIFSSFYCPCYGVYCSHLPVQQVPDRNKYLAIWPEWQCIWLRWQGDGSRVAAVVVSGRPRAATFSTHPVPADSNTPQDTAGPVGEAGSTSVKAYFIKGKYCADFEDGGKKCDKESRDSEGERSAPGAIGDILLQPVSFSRDHDGFGISLELMERVTSEQIFTLQHVTDTSPGQVDISWSTATCGETCGGGLS